jgi:hypothetical protein
MHQRVMSHLEVDLVGVEKAKGGGEAKKNDPLKPVTALQAITKSFSQDVFEDVAHTTGFTQ